MRNLILSIIIAFSFSTAYAQNSNKSENLDVLLDWFVNPDHAPLIIAHVNGHFEKHNLKVSLIPPADPSAPPRLIAAKKADIAISYQPQLHLFADQKLPLQRFGTLVASPLNSLIVLEDSPIKSIKDLRDKKIGFSVGGFEQAVLSAMLEKHGLFLSDVTLINVNFALSSSLYSGNVDAVIGAFRNFELNQMKLSKKPGRAFFVEEEGVPPYDELIFIAHKKRLQNPIFRKKISKFLNAIEDATIDIMNRPEQRWKDFISYQEDLDTPLNALAWKDTLRRFALRPAALDVQRYKNFAEFLLKKGVTQTNPSVDSYATTLSPLKPF
jgi:putative hydroxymethylpyrimidine transport system substrate-binding protein